VIETFSRQEVLNVAFARALHDERIVVAPESVLRYDGRRRLPDVIVRYQVLLMIIEGEIDDQPEAAEKAYRAARRRLEEGLTHIAVGVVYPSRLRNLPYEELWREFHRTKLRFTVLTISALEPRFTTGSFKAFREALEHAYEHLLQEDEVERATEIIDGAVERFAEFVLQRFYNRDKITKAIAEALEMPYDPESKPKRKRKPTEHHDAADAPEDDSAPEPQARSEMEHYGGVCRIGGLVVMNALIFQEILSQHDSSVKNLQTALAERTPVFTFTRHWQHILETINYYPIFHLAQKVLSKLPNTPLTLELFEALIQSALRITSMRAALQHDLMGRVYHRLLAQAKYLGTYYTSVPAAILLLKLALDPKRWDVAWHDLDAIRQLRVADLACGSGTLLMAAANTITSNHVSTSSYMGLAPHRAELQKALSEEIIYGYDVLASAVHLTASTLALRAPEQPFAKMNLFALPLGGEGLKLGSLEFGNTFEIALQQDLFGSAKQVTGEGERTLYQAPLPKLDLCVMNPPFVRSTKGNLLFGSMPAHLRRDMQKRLQRMIQQRNLSASTTAGLGSIFVAVAHPYIKEGGRIALVLPKALLSGVAWAKTRQLLNQHYRLEYLVVSHDPERWNFSYNTDLSEVLLVARKVTDDESGMPEGERPDLYALPKPKGNGAPTIHVIRHNPLAKAEHEGVVVINLRHNVHTAMEALVVSWRAMDTEHAKFLGRQGGTAIYYGDDQLAETCLVPDSVIAENWMLPCAFAQIDLARAAYHLLHNEVWTPGARRNAPIKLCKLSELGVLGPDSRDVMDGFELTRTRTIYPAFWGHTASEVVTIAQQHNQYLTPRPFPLPGRPLRLAEDLLPLAGRLLLGARMRLNTQRLFAVYLPQPVLSNVWWSFSFHRPNERHKPDERREKALALWLNSTLHILIVLANRVETQGAWVKFNKPTLANLPVLNVKKLTPKRLDSLAEAYDRLCEQTLLPFPQMGSDPVRAEIDKALSEALGLPDLSNLRMLLAQEPVISLKRL